MEKLDFFSLALAAFGIWLAVSYKRSADRVNTDTSAKLVSIETNTKAQLTAVQTDINTKLTAIQTDINIKLTAVQTDVNNKLATVQTDVNTNLTTVQTDVNTNLRDTRTDIGTKLVEIKAESLVISRDIMSELKLYNEAFRKGEITNNIISGRKSITSKALDIEVGDNITE